MNCELTVLKFGPDSFLHMQLVRTRRLCCSADTSARFQAKSKLRDYVRDSKVLVL